MIKTRTQLIPALFVALTLTACGGGGEGTADPAEEAAADAAEAVEETGTDAADAADAVAEDATEAADTVAEDTSEAADTVAEGASEAADAVAEGASEAADAVAEGASEATDAVADTAAAASDAIDPTAWEDIDLDLENNVASLQEAFPDLSMEEITATAGDPEQLVSLVEEKYGVTREAAQEQVMAWANSL